MIRTAILPMEVSSAAKTRMRGVVSPVNHRGAMANRATANLIMASRATASRATASPQVPRSRSLAAIPRTRTGILAGSSRAAMASQPLLRSRIRVRRHAHMVARHRAPTGVRRHARLVARHPSRIRESRPTGSQGLPRSRTMVSRGRPHNHSMGSRRCIPSRQRRRNRAGG